MKYRIVWTSRAKIQFYEAATWWAEHRSPHQASKWVSAFNAAIAGLASHPEKWSLAPESDLFPVTMRQLLFGLGKKPTHRAVFIIQNGAVKIIAIRHMSQDALSPDDN